MKVLKEIFGGFRLPNFTSICKSSNYDISKLKKDIKTNGLQNDVTVFKIITIVNNEQHEPEQREPSFPLYPDIKYQLWDGNHRCFVLKELYGDDHKINVNIDKIPLISNNCENQLLTYCFPQASKCSPLHRLLRMDYNLLPKTNPSTLKMYEEIQARLKS